MIALLRAREVEEEKYLLARNETLTNSIKISDSTGELAEKGRNDGINFNARVVKLNNDYKNVSGSLEEKTRTIGGAKDLAIDLQKRANDLAGQASNKLNYLSGTRFLPKIGFTNATSRFFTL